jgi:O-antigen/teichoic acid export membrane protein
MSEVIGGSSQADAEPIYQDAGMDAALPGVAELVEREGRLPEGVLAAGLRRHTSRGTVINAAFQIGIAGLNLLRRMVVAIFLTRSEFGVWGAVLATLFLVLFIKDAGFGDKFIQQAEEDQEAAFQKLLTLELMLSGVATVLAFIAVPVFAAVYGRPELIAPGLVLTLAILGNTLQVPNVIYYRQMNFVRQRTLQIVDPVVAFIVTVGLAVAGAGYWSLVIGAVLGSFAGAAVALKMCPYRIRLRFQRGTLAEYFHFSWPLVLSSGEFIAVGQAALIIATRTNGLAAAGAIGLAIAITQFSQGVDNIVTQTAYPAICAVRKRMDLLFEVFVKSNRLALMWGMPFGFGVALFAPDLVHFVLGEKWQPAIVVMQALGIVVAVDQIGFNWSAFLRALNHTRPMATISLLDAAAFLLVTTPLLIEFGLPGFAAGALFAEVVRLSARSFYLKRLFSSLGVIRHMIRAFAPVVPGIAVVLLARLLEPGARTQVTAIAELAAYGLVIVAATVVLERDLLREIWGYLRPSRKERSGSGIEAVPAS